ncbi:MAG: leucine-rich repeat protein [Bacteroidales bacterium]|nr:leucine-rich repeat protein [Bacteroidales bacterium]
MRVWAVIALLLSVCLSVHGQAYDFAAAAPTGQTLYYKISNQAARTVTVVNPTGNRGNQTWTGYTAPSGALTIPASVSNGGVSYNVTAVGAFAFGYCNAISTVTLPAGVASIGNGAFFSCGGMSAITFPSGLSVIDTQAFSNCQYLQSLQLPASLREVRYSAFSSCSNVTGTLTIPDGVQTIGDFAFGSCNKVRKLVVGSGVRTIGDRAFAMCFRIDSIEMLPIVPPTVQSRTFSHTTGGMQPVSPNTPVHVPCGSLPAYLTAPNWNYFNHIWQDATCPQITRYDTSLCANKLPCTWRGHYFSAQGSCIDTLRAASGVDSLVIYSLTTKDTSVHVTTASTCGVFAWHGTNYTRSGTYRYRMSNANAQRCDSVDVLQLTVRRASNGDTVATGCDSLTWHGVTYYSSTTLQEGLLQGAFSVSSTRQVAFARGNLQYQASTQTWRLAGNQYDVIGRLNRAIGAANTGWIDLFGWGTSGWNNGNVYYRPYDYVSSGVGSHGYGPTDGSSYLYSLTGQWREADWGVHNAITGAGGEAGLWRTLTRSEWQYVINGRNNAAQLRGLASVQTPSGPVQGLMLLPDGWTLPAGVSFTPGGANSYTAAQWQIMEANGALLLPAAGYRDMQTYYPLGGHYWSSTTEDIEGAVAMAFSTTSSTANASREPRYRGCAVRLVHDLACFTMTGGNRAGCDSVVTLYLTIHHPTRGDTSATVCDSMWWLGNRLTASGSWRSDSLARPCALHNRYGCDSSVRLLLTVNHGSSATVADTIVRARLPWQYHSLTVAAAWFEEGCDVWDTTATVTIANHWGCDSVIEYRLTVRRDVADTVDSTVCENGMPMTWNGVSFGLEACNGQGDPCVISRDRCFAGMGSHGEDSVLTMRLHVRMNSSARVSDTIVENQLPWIWMGDVYTDSASDTRVLRNAAGCDSVVGYHLYVHRNVRDTADSTVCEGRLPMRWNGRIFDTIGLASSAGPLTISQSVTLRARTGADSVVLMRLRVLRNSRAQVNDTIVENQLPWSRMGNSYSYSTSDTVRVAAANGCDSVIYYHLHVWLNVRATADSTVCEGRLPLRWNHRLFDTAGMAAVQGIWNRMMRDTLTAGTGADSLLTMRLHVLRNSRAHVSDTIVENQLPWSWHGTSYTGSTRDTAHVTAANGCDSVIYYTLHVWMNVRDTADSTVCRNQLPLWWNHRLFTAAMLGTAEGGTLMLADTLRAGTGADSLLTMRLRVGAVYDHHRYDTVCSDSSLLFMGFRYRLPGVYPHALHSSTGCDSTVTLHLAVNHVSQATVHDTIVENQLPWNYGGTSYTGGTTGGGDTITLTNAVGCDSVVSYHLYVHRNVRDTADSTVCEGALPLRWNHRLFDTAGIAAQAGVWHVSKADTLRAWTGADSLLTMRLYVLRNSRARIGDTIVENRLPWSWHGTSYTGSTRDTVVVTAENGCDSVIYYTLHVWRNIVDTADTAVCPTALPLLWNGVSFRTDSTAAYRMAGAGSHGEDSTVVMRMRVKANTAAAVHDTVVENRLPVRYHDSVFTGPVSGRRFTLRNAAGCDSMVTYSLFVHWNQYTREDSTVCENALPLLWNGAVRTGEGTRADTLRSRTGADSIVLRTLHVLRNSSARRADTIVEDRLPYSAMGCRFRGDVGDTVVVTVNAAGCDSVVHYSLHVWRNRRGSVDSALCEGLLPLLWKGHRVATDSCVVDTMHAIGPHGEDSITRLCLRVLRNSSSQVSDTVAENNMPWLWHGTSYTGNTRDTVTVTAGNGCDSVIYYRLYVCMNSRAEADSAVCAYSLPLLWNGAVFTTDTVAAIVLRNWCGADSVLTLRVAVHDSTSSHVRDTIVENRLPWQWQGMSYTGSASDTRVLRNAEGCDSVVYYTLHVWMNVHVWLDSGVCASRLSLTWDGHRMDSAATYDYVYPAATGADSIRHYRLAVYQSVTEDDTVRACDSYTWCGHTFRQSGQYMSSSYRQMHTYHGCDSVRRLLLTVGHANGSTFSVTACGSYSWLGHTFAQPGTYSSSQYASLLNVQGCDSVAVMQLTLYYADTMEIYDTFCQGTGYHYFDTVLTRPGVYTRVLAGRHGCDSVLLLRLSVIEPPPVSIGVTALCSSRSYLLQSDTSLRYRLWSSYPEDTLLERQGEAAAVLVMPLAPTTYTLYADYYDYPRCPATGTVQLDPLRVVKAKMDYSPTQLSPDRMELTAIDRSQRTDGRRWFIDGAFHSDRQTLNYRAGIEDTNVLLALEVFSDRCRDTVVALIPVIRNTMYIPNVFTPDESENNTFGVEASEISGFHITIYARNGIVVYESDDPGARWDGRSGGMACPQGSYVYIVTYREGTSPDAVATRKGTVLLLR